MYILWENPSNFDSSIQAYPCNLLLLLSSIICMHIYQHLLLNLFLYSLALKKSEVSAKTIILSVKLNIIVLYLKLLECDFPAGGQTFW